MAYGVCPNLIRIHSVDMRVALNPGPCMASSNQLLYLSYIIQMTSATNQYTKDVLMVSKPNFRSLNGSGTSVAWKLYVMDSAVHFILGRSEDLFH